jgi:arylsulfatase A-like enzyme
VDGISRWSQLCGEASDDREEMYFEWGYTRAVRTRNWKYIAWRHTPEELDDMQSGEVGMAYNMFGKASADFAMHMYPHYWDADQLYDLDNDPGEQHNLAGDPACADVLRDMQARLQRYLDTFDCPFGLAPQPFRDSPEYARLVEATMADQRLYQSDWYIKHAY